MAVSTVTVTATMDYQDGLPYEGWLEFRLAAASKTDEALVGPRLGWQTAQFSDGVASVEAVPNSELEEGTFYKVRIWKEETSSSLRSRTKILDAVAVVPDADCNLRDIITAAPATPSQQDVLEALLSQAQEAATSAAQSAASASGDAETASTASETAVNAKDLAVSAKDDAVEAKDLAVSARVDAVAAKDLAVSARADAIDAKDDAVEAKSLAVSAKETAVSAADRAEAAAAAFTPMTTSEVAAVFAEEA